MTSCHGHLVLNNLVNVLCPGKSLSKLFEIEHYQTFFKIASVVLSLLDLFNAFYQMKHNSAITLLLKINTADNEQLENHAKREKTS